ncbi:MAG: hypothetical protein A2104_09440 [Candidatus Melainabacteria bacterium GWF2_32_7]|nr:MAG: hypothetical protein A2104_09440 [Candidatus Melainabacteria bacterium GWF2_32_7]
MGLAASQARFLSLTARKSDLEFNAQQVNQDRMRLARETETLFEEYLKLKVPSPYPIDATHPDANGNGLADLYESDQMAYEAEVSRINALTEGYHSQDRVLEINLKNLETQQKEVQTEIDSVKKVIDKNIEMTFKTFA